MAVCASKSVNIRIIPWIWPNHNKGLSAFYTNVKNKDTRISSKMSVCASKFATIHVIPLLWPNHKKGLSAFCIHVKNQRYKSMKQNGCLCKQICKYSCNSMDSAQS